MLQPRGSSARRDAAPPDCWMATEQPLDARRAAKRASSSSSNNSNEDRTGPRRRECRLAGVSKMKQPKPWASWAKKLSSLSPCHLVILSLSNLAMTCAWQLLSRTFHRHQAPKHTAPTAPLEKKMASPLEKKKTCRRHRVPSPPFLLCCTGVDDVSMSHCRPPASCPSKRRVEHLGARLRWLAAFMSATYKQGCRRSFTSRCHHMRTNVCSFPLHSHLAQLLVHG